jgi:hypothetical protein
LLVASTFVLNAKFRTAGYITVDIVDLESKHCASDMIVRFTLTLLAASTALARQIPIVDGVIGGVLSNLGEAAVQRPSVTPLATTPGKLRVTENSGVCGM